jgi:DHA1 family bicyclomycin/chloramphenicol resistance-like MFS transporter
MPSARTARDTRTALAGGCLAGFAVSWNLTNTGAIATQLSHHYGTGLVAVGLLTSIAFLAEFLVMIPGGRAIDRWGARDVALASIALCAVGNALLLAVPGIGAALALRWLIGFGVGAGFVAGSVWLTSDPRGRTPLGQGLYGGIALAGAGVATGAVPLLEGSLGWRASYETGLAVSLAGLALAAACAGGRGHGEQRETTPLRTLVANRTIARLGALHTASFAFSIIAGNWIVTLLTRHTGLSTGAAGAVGALTLLLGVVGRPLGGWAARRHPDRAYGVLVGSLLAVAASVAVLAVSGSVALSAVAAATLGLASGIPFGAVVDAAATAFPRAPGEAIGAFNLYAVTAVIAGTPLVGLTFSLSGDGRVGFAALAVLAALATTAIPRGAFHSRPEPAG